MGLRSRVTWVLTFRALFLLVMAGSGLMLHLFYDEPFTNDLIWLLGFGFVFETTSIILFYFLKKWKFQALAWSQIIFDLVFTSFLVNMTGGISSAYVLLYVVNILVAAILYYSAGALSSAVGSSLLYLLLTSHSWIAEVATNPHIFSRGMFTTSALLFFGAAIAFVFRQREHLAKSLEQTTANLIELNHLHSTIISHIPSGILFLDRQGRVQFLNEAATKILETPLSGEYLERTAFAELLKNEGRFETPITTAATTKILGHHRVVLPSGSSLVVFQDVTNIRDLEIRAQLQEKLAAIGQLGAGIAHEIRNPLASLSGSIQVLRDEIPVNENTEKLVKIILRETDRLQVLTQNFLDYAKPSQSRAEDVDINSILESLKVLISNSEVFTRKNPKLIIPYVENSICHCDPKQLEQILWNLVKNAVEAVPAGGEVEVNVRQQGEQRIFEVRDSGPGIPLEHQKKVFDPFFTTKSTGTGLGLSLVYQMVKSHGGQVRVESKISGTTFTVEIPDRNIWSKPKRIGGLL